MTRLAPIMQGFFTDHLITQRHASPHTVASYRDTFRLLLGYAHQRSGKLPAQLDIADLDAVLIGAFLTHLETERGNSAATRNARLTAIRALFRYASLRAPEHAALIARVLAIPAKRTDTTIWSPGNFVDISIMLLSVPNCQIGARNPLGLSCRADVVSGRDCNIARCSRTRRS